MQIRTGLRFCDRRVGRWLTDVTSVNELYTSGSPSDVRVPGNLARGASGGTHTSVGASRQNQARGADADHLNDLESWLAPLAHSLKPGQARGRGRRWAHSQFVR